MDLSRAAWRKSTRSGGNGGQCVEVAAVDLSRAAWRKSTRSAGNGGSCVEVAAVDLPRDAWRKSTRSGGQGGECVEVAPAAARVAVRDSKRPHGGALAFTAGEWEAFAGAVKTGRFD